MKNRIIKMVIKINKFYKMFRKMLFKNKMKSRKKFKIKKN